MTLRSVPKSHSFEAALADTAHFVEQSLDALLPQPAGPEAQLLDAMRYATLNGVRYHYLFAEPKDGKVKATVFLVRFLQLLNTCYFVFPFRLVPLKWQPPSNDISA